MITKEKKKIKDLYRAILALDSIAEAERFFRDLLTEQEIKEFANRWKAAIMLDQKIPYVEIEKETGLSSRTISRVAKWLNNGKNGYRLVIDRIKHHHSFPTGKELF